MKLRCLSANIIIEGRLQLVKMLRAAPWLVYLLRFTGIVKFAAPLTALITTLHQVSPARVWLWCIEVRSNCRSASSACSLQSHTAQPGMDQWTSFNYNWARTECWVVLHGDHCFNIKTHTSWWLLVWFNIGLNCQESAKLNVISPFVLNLAPNKWPNRRTENIRTYRYAS